MRYPKSDNQAIDDIHAMALGLEFYRQIVETASDGVVTINQNHEVIYMNLAAEELYGYRREEILGGDLAPLIPPEHREKHKSYVDRYLDTRKSRFLGSSMKTEIVRKDGTRLPVSISFNLADSESGPLFTAIMRDHSAEENMAQKVRNAESMAAVGRLVATVNHEIKTPMVLIGGFARQIAKEKGLSEKGRHKLEIITSEVGRLEGVLDELRDLTRQSDLKKVELDVGGVVDHVAELMHTKLVKDGVSIRVSKKGRLPLVMADKDRLAQVLINLINNAAQSYQEGGKVEIKACTSVEGGVAITVKDAGSGIEASKLSEIFTPFYTTKQFGTGLGLSVSKRIVEEHGGCIDLKSRQGEGTTVVVTLPAAHCEINCDR